MEPRERELHPVVLFLLSPSSSSSSSSSSHRRSMGVSSKNRALLLLPCFLLLLLHLLLPPHLLLASTTDENGGETSEKQRAVTLKKLQWGKKNDASPSSAQILNKSTRISNSQGRARKWTAILEMKHYTCCSGKMENQQEDEEPRKLLMSDNARVSSLHSRIRRGGIQQAEMPLGSGARLQSLNYVVTVAVGGQKATMVVDTGSDLTWLQCKPCISCYNQQDPLFDPLNSSTYQPVPCNSSACGALALATGTSGACDAEQPSCGYSLSYGDGSFTRGVLGTEQIDLGGVVVNGLIFGCGRSNHGLFGGTSGLMGLGRTPLSLISQTSAQFGGVFSYCLPTGEFDSYGSLVLGGDPSVYKNSTPIVYTRMISDPQQGPFYFLNLTGLSVGGKPIEAPGFSTGRVLIDSGTVITRLVPSVYRALKAEFLRQFARYPAAPGFSILDTCFNLSGLEEVTIPTLRLQFDGVEEVSVDVTGVLYFVRKDASQVCLALASLAYEDDTGILGNYQQKDLRIVYDVAGSRVGFAEEVCGYN